MQMSATGAALARPQAALTRGGCVGCHTHATLTINGTIPVVLTTAAPAATMLAGGNFHWVAAGEDAMGHNVLGLASQDPVLRFEPPGWTYDALNFNAIDGRAVTEGSTTPGSWTAQLTCAGIFGCHGAHVALDDFSDISGAHHAPDSAIDGETVGSSFRFLKGILGVEDPNWEYTTATYDHNYYKGDIRVDDNPVTVDKTTISFLCAQCHGRFHSGNLFDGIDDDDFGAAWLRHPIDIQLPTVGEYAAYDPVHEYANDAPVGYENPANPLRVDAVVTCLSCHRAHGSDQPDLLRWDYSLMDAHDGDDDTGCFRCHTTKDNP